MRRTRGSSAAARRARPTGNSGESALAVDTRAVAAAREVVRTGSVQLSVDDAEDGAAAVARIAGDAGGFVADEQARARDHEVDITVRVPADTFEDVVQELGAIRAALQNRAATGEDVQRLLEAAEWLDRRGGELLGRDRSGSQPAS